MASEVSKIMKEIKELKIQGARRVAAARRASAKKSSRLTSHSTRCWSPSPSRNKARTRSCRSWITPTPTYTPMRC